MSGLLIRNTKEVKQFLKIWTRLDPIKCEDIICMNPLSTLSTNFTDIEATAKYFCTGLGRIIDADVVTDDDGKEKTVRYYLSIYKYFKGVSALVRANVPFIKDSTTSEDRRIQEVTRTLITKIRKEAFEQNLPNVHAYMGYSGSGIIIIGEDVTEEFRENLEIAGDLKTEECLSWWDEHGLKDFYEERLAEMKKSKDQKKESFTTPSTNQPEETPTPEQLTTSIPPTAES